MTSSIEWTERTLNPSTGCDRVSPGCDNCYALTLAARLKSMGQPKYQTDGNPRTSGPVPVFVKQLSGGRRANHDIDTFPPGLRVREYPQAVTA